MRRLSGFLALSGSQRRLLFAAVVALPICIAGLRLIGFRRLRNLFSRLTPIHRHLAPGNAAAQAGAVERTAWAVRVAAGHGIASGRCLQQSMALWWLLRRQNLESEIRFGARRLGGNLEAHAWVEFAGLAVAPGPEGDPAFTPFSNARRAGEAGGS